MFLALPNGTQLRGDLIVKAEQRYDLLPVPSTLTLYVRAEDAVDPSVRDGSVLLAGAKADRYRIVKSKKLPTEWVQGGQQPVKLAEVIALLDGLTDLAKPLPRPVVKENSSLGEVYRACGARARVAVDIPIRLFVCPSGHIATPGIAQLLQEEAAAAVWRNEALSFVRLPDLFTQESVQKVNADVTEVVESQFLEQHEIPAGVSTNPDGTLLQGRRDIARPLLFLPRTPGRVLNNISRCLVVRRKISTAYAGEIQAGQCITFGGTKHVIVTAVHSWESGSGGGDVKQVSRFWLAELSK